MKHILSGRLRFVNHYIHFLLTHLIEYCTISDQKGAVWVFRQVQMTHSGDLLARGGSSFHYLIEKKKH